jgi:hypothetical protein
MQGESVAWDCRRPLPGRPGQGPVARWGPQGLGLDGRDLGGNTGVGSMVYRSAVPSSSTRFSRGMRQGPAPSLMAVRRPSRIMR